MRYLSVCSGIEAASVAWHPLGWEAAAFSEIEPFPRAVLAHRWPGVPCHGDFTTIRGDEYGAVDVLVGGTPCQDFSIAGLRAGIAGERGNLTLEFLRLVARARPRWIVWENVPGLLSSDDGRALGAFLGGLAELRYGFAYRILDAQYAGLAQRRDRVFVVAHLGDWRRAAAVLLERESLRWDPPPRREAGQGIARPITPGSPGGSGYRNDADTADNLIAFGGNNTGGPIDVATACNAHGGPHGRLDFESETFGVTAFSAKDHGADAGPLAPTLWSGGFDKSHANGGVMPAIAFDSPTNRSQPRPGRPCHPLSAEAHLPAVALNNTGQGWWNASEVASPVRDMSAGSGTKEATLVGASVVRRLTPRECERLQGFPDDYTRIPRRLYKARRITKSRPADLWDRVNGGWILMAADGPRYKALGNSMAVPVMRWIGERIAMVEALSSNRSNQ